MNSNSINSNDDSNHSINTGSEGGMIRLETLIELKFLNSSFSSLFSA